MGIIVQGATGGQSQKKGTVASVGEAMLGLGDPRLNTAFFKLSNNMPDHPLTLKQARIVNAGRLLVPPSLTIAKQTTELFAVQSESKNTGYCGQFLYGIGGEVDSTFYDDAVECIIVVLLQDIKERSFQYMLGVNGRNVYKPRSDKLVKHWRAKRGWFRGWEDQWKLGDGDLADQNIVKWSIDSELSVRQGELSARMKPEIEGNTATCTVVFKREATQ